MTNAPRVSVVMCAYNGIGVIEQAVGDIRSQNFADWELLISDDGSSDGTRDYLAGLDDPRIRVILQQRNLGYVRNKNAAIAAARGDLITQQDQDDRTNPERLSLMVAALDRSRHAIAGCGYRRLDVQGSVTFETELDHELVVTAYDPASPYPFWFPSLMAYKEIYSAVGPFDEYFAGAFGDDLYWTVKANEQYPIFCLPERHYDYIESLGSITSSPENDRKLVMSNVLEHLLRQRGSSGTDDLEQGRVKAFEKSLLADKGLLARKLQVYAARAIDQSRWADARALIYRAFKLDSLSPSLLRTIIYYCRSQFKHG